MRTVVAIALVAGCGFDVSGNGAVDARPHDAMIEPGMDADAAPAARWWNPAWTRRRPLVVTTGNVRPMRGYAGYTVRVQIEDLPGLANNGQDLRVVVDDGEAFTVLPHHVIRTGTAIDLRFALPQDIADSGVWRDAALYYGNPSAPLPADPAGTAVYLWWDPVTTNRLADYTHGRMDAWLGVGYADSWAFQVNAYAYDTTNDGQAGLRRAVDERDVLVEASWFHTGCYTNNMQSGVCARIKIATGGPTTEQSTDYYCSSRAQNPACNNTDQGLYDGDVVDGDNESIALQNVNDPTPIVPNQWRAQALAVFGAAPAKLRFWDADVAWTTLATPPATALIATGEALHQHAEAGAAGIMTAQDLGRVRDIVIRRYTEPEPTVVGGAEQSAP